MYIDKTNLFLLWWLEFFPNKGPVIVIVALHEGAVEGEEVLVCLEGGPLELVPRLAKVDRKVEEIYILGSVHGGRTLQQENNYMSGSRYSRPNFSWHIYRAQNIGKQTNCA